MIRDLLNGWYDLGLGSFVVDTLKKHLDMLNQDPKFAELGITQENIGERFSRVSEIDEQIWPKVYGFESAQVYY